MRRFLLSLALVSGLALAAPGPIKFKITLDPGVSPGTVSGRLFVLMSDKPEKMDRITTSFIPGGSWIAATELEALKPGESVTFDPDAKAYPQPFSTAKKATRQFMVLLDVDHSYAYGGQGEGDISGPVVQIPDVDPASTEPIEAPML